MSLKTSKMSIQQTTVFWKNLGIVIPKRARTLKTYRPNSDFSSLRRIGITHDAIQEVYTLTLRHNDQLLFRKFSRFFRKDVDTIVTWTKSKNVSESFIRLFKLYNRSSLVVAKKKFSELALIFEFYKKGESQLYQGSFTRSKPLKKFTTTNLRRRLNRIDGKANYIEVGQANYGKSKIFWLQKKAESKITNKFIKITIQKKSIAVSLSMDSKLEYFAAKSAIEKYFSTYLDTPEIVGKFTQFENFIKKGSSNHFVLTGANYTDNEFRVSISPNHNRIENITQLETYNQKLRSTTKKLEAISQLRLSYNDKSLTRPVFISILTYKDGVFGSILLKPDDKGMTTKQRVKFYNDFFHDFNIPLNQFIKYEDLAEKDLYRYFLQTTAHRSTRLELRSSHAMIVYKTLVSDNLLSQSENKEDISRVCVNSSCKERFKQIWDSKKFCTACGDILVPGKSIELQSVDEEAVATYLSKNTLFGSSTLFKRTLLSRQIYVVQHVDKDKIIEFIPVTKQLSENQFEILKFRYPYAVIITSRNDKTDIELRGFRVVTLWELIHSMQKDNSKIIKHLQSKSKTGILVRLRSLTPLSIERLNNKEYYIERNQEVKNFGAELFEADCSILLDYVFGNCIWLGAKHRGSSLPDGFTSFPMLGIKHGCFIWDTKFSEGKKLVMGNFTKNNHYINEAKNNKSIKINGGLKAFIFISNNEFPLTFPKKYISLTKKRKIKVLFLQSQLLKQITEHYLENEKIIMNNSRARNQFIQSMKNLFFVTAKNRKCEIISSSFVETLITSNDAFFNSLKSGKQLSP
jgi:hypothetical protein